MSGTKCCIKQQEQRDNEGRKASEGDKGVGVINKKKKSRKCAGGKMEEADSQRDEGLSDTKDPASCLMMQAALGLMTFHFRPAGLMLTLEWSLYGCGRIDRKLGTLAHAANEMALLFSSAHVISSAGSEITPRRQKGFLSVR